MKTQWFATKEDVSYFKESSSFFSKKWQFLNIYEIRIKLKIQRLKVILEGKLVWPKMVNFVEYISPTVTKYAPKAKGKKDKGAVAS